MKTRYEYNVVATNRQTKAVVAQMTCFGDNRGDAVHHATQWWADTDKCDYGSWCKITATRTGKTEKV